MRTTNRPTHHVEAISSDGVHFIALGTLTTKGLDPTNPQPTWGDMAYDPATGYWYAGIQSAPGAILSTTGKVHERGQYGIELYRIPDASLLTGSHPVGAAHDRRHLPDRLRIEFSAWVSARPVWQSECRFVSGDTDVHFDLESAAALECHSCP